MQHLRAPYSVVGGVVRRWRRRDAVGHGRAPLLGVARERTQGGAQVVQGHADAPSHPRQLRVSAYLRRPLLGRLRCPRFISFRLCSFLA